MAKKVQAYVKLQVAAGMANPSPPVGPALGQQGVNIMEFCKAFNAKTESIAQTKAADMTGSDIEAMTRSIEGTARSMGLVVED
ncbi:hypothetical protein [Enterobacter sp.]|uniref:hypothetical protein n=1 Tax=Enterobacter sp. TaxID=42895 RepID=UPI0029034559|nr:hypothetical protein [Enterobacter sp.]MDU1563340.1 hypothetical protein [Enterobacter sp.]